jgi:hypothetical protein
VEFNSFVSREVPEMIYSDCKAADSAGYYGVIMYRLIDIIMLNPEVALFIHHAKIGNQRVVQLSSQFPNLINIQCFFFLYNGASYCLRFKRKRLMTLQ